MSAHTKAIDSTDWQLLLDELNEIRLSRDWSYRELADDITRVTGADIAGQTLHQALAVARADRPKPYDRTLYKIQRYLDAVKRGKRASA